MTPWSVFQDGRYR